MHIAHAQWGARQAGPTGVSCPGFPGSFGVPRILIVYHCASEHVCLHVCALSLLMLASSSVQLFAPWGLVVCHGSVCRVSVTSYTSWEKGANPSNEGLTPYIVDTLVPAIRGVRLFVNVSFLPGISDPPPLPELAQCKFHCEACWRDAGWTHCLYQLCVLYL